MPRLAANLTMMFNEVDFLDRFAAAASAGFGGVEFLFPYHWSPIGIATRLQDNNLTPALFNMPPGDWEAGDRGLASITGRQDEFKAGVDIALRYANALDCHQIHMMAGITNPQISRQSARDTFVENLQYAANACLSENITLLLEPINHRDMPGYFVTHQEQAIELIALAGQPNVALQMDFYHCQITQGDLARHFLQNIDQIGHIQIAGVPERHEPDIGEINYTYLLDAIDNFGYEGWVGCEYRPANGTQAGLGWAASYLKD